MAQNKENFDLVINAKDKARGVLSSLKSQIIAVGGAYLTWQAGKEIIGDSIKKAMDYEATIQSLVEVTKATGRDAMQVYSEMQKHVGGLASEASVATGFLKGMTTTLDVEQISKMTQAVKDASIAMGEDFNTQLPLIIKAVKQLNPAILDNIGVTVRLDQVNKKIREGFYGAGTAINEYTQQNAIFQEIMKQTQIYQGQEAKLLETNAGQAKKLAADYDNLKVKFGALFQPIVTKFLMFAGDLVMRLIEIVKRVDFASFFEPIKERFAGFIDIIVSIGRTIWETLKNIATGIKTTFEPALDIILPAIKRILEEIGGVWEWILEIVSTKEFEVALSGVANALAIIISLISGLLKITVAVFKGLAKIVWETAELLVDIFSGAWDIIKGIFTGGFDEAWEAMKQKFSEGSSEIADAAVEAYNEVKEASIIAAEEFWTDATQAVDNVKEVIDDTGEATRQSVTETATVVKDTTKEAFQKAADEMGVLPKKMTEVEKEVSKSTRATAKFVVTLADNIESELSSAVQSAIGNFKIFREQANSVLGQIGQFLLRIILETAAALVIEAAKAAILTKRYIALAAAKSAVNPISAGARVGAAAATTAGLNAITSPLLGFDDVLNDATAFRHGQDYAQQFIQGQSSIFNNSDYADRVVDMTPERSFAGSGGTTINITVEGSIVNPDELGSVLEETIARGRSRIATESEFFSGWTDVEDY